MRFRIVLRWKVIQVEIFEYGSFLLWKWFWSWPKKIKSMFFCHLILLFHVGIIFFLPFVYIKIIIFATIKCLNNLSTCSWKVGQKMVGRLLESDGNGSHKGSPTTTNFTHQDKSCFRLLLAYIQLSFEELEAFRIYPLQSESVS